MAPPNRKRRPSKAADQRGPRRGKPKVCVFCADRTMWADYKDVNVLRRFLSDRGRIRSREYTGTCAQHQRDVATAIKTARELALLPYAVRVPVADRPGGRGGRGGPRGDRPRPPRTDGASAPAAGPNGAGGEAGQAAAPTGEAGGGDAQTPATPDQG